MTKWNKYSSASVGCWKTAIALQVAAELKRYGFRIKVRGRGHRPKRLKNNNPYDYVPLTEATHAHVYILEGHWDWQQNRYVKDVEIIEEKEYTDKDEYIPLEGLLDDPRVEALIAAIDP